MTFPSKNNVKEVVIDENVINGGAQPMLVCKTDEEMQAEEEENFCLKKFKKFKNQKPGSKIRVFIF